MLSCKLHVPELIDKIIENLVFIVNFLSLGTSVSIKYKHLPHI